jgi:alpha-L-rhamnosidase
LGIHLFGVINRFVFYLKIKKNRRSFINIMKKFHFCKYICPFFLQLLLCFSVYGQNSNIYALKTEHLINPIGLQHEEPRFSWVSEVEQIKFQLVVSTDSLLVRAGKGDVWHYEGLGNTSLVAFKGQPLKSFTTYYWMVRVEDSLGVLHMPTQVARFETGMMQLSDWEGHWIADHQPADAHPAPYYRKPFQLQKPVKEARLYIAVGGLAEVYLNGKMITEDRLLPVYSRFDRRIYALAYDVTEHLSSGSQAIGVILGNGWYNHQSKAVWNFDQAPWRNRPTFCLDLRITYEDGQTEVISTDLTWKTNSGPIQWNSIYTAEHADAQLEEKNWHTGFFDDTHWKGVKFRSAPAPQIDAQQMVPIRDVDTLAPQQFKKINNQLYWVDFGRNFAGTTQIRLQGSPGTRVRVKHGERLDSLGRLDLSNINVYHRPQDDNDPFQTDIWTLGSESNVFRAKFNYKGFRYVEIESDAPIELAADDIVAMLMHSDVPLKGTIHTSNSLLNRILWATNNAYLSNLFGYPTDCPQREKNGWTGDGHFAIETALYNYDGITVYEKWMNDHRDEQQPNGVLPDIIPTSGWGYSRANGTDWTSSMVIIPWNLYVFYGDVKPLNDNFEAMKRYVDYVTALSPTGLTTFGRGDWVPVRSTSSLEFTSSIYYYVAAHLLSEAAQVLEKREDHLKYQSLAKKIKDAINATYFNPTIGQYASGTQTELSMPLQWGIVPEGKHQQVANLLAQRVKNDGLQIDVGVLGAKSILNALSENGYPTLAYQLATNDSYPSWGWWIRNGATTLLENWDLDAERDISDNHMMFGEIGAWTYKALGGLKPDPKHPGFAHFFLEPHLEDDLNQVSMQFESPKGTIKMEWQRKGKQIKMEIQVPANSRATFRWDTKKWKSIQLNAQVQKEPSFELLPGTHQLVFKR